MNDPVIQAMTAEEDKRFIDACNKVCGYPTIGEALAAEAACLRRPSTPFVYLNPHTLADCLQFGRNEKPPLIEQAEPGNDTYERG